MCRTVRLQSSVKTETNHVQNAEYSAEEFFRSITSVRGLDRQVHVVWDSKCSFSDWTLKTSVIQELQCDTRMIKPNKYEEGPSLSREIIVTPPVMLCWRAGVGSDRLISLAVHVCHSGNRVAHLHFDCVHLAQDSINHPLMKVSQSFPGGQYLVKALCDCLEIKIVVLQPV